MLILQLLCSSTVKAQSQSHIGEVHRASPYYRNKKNVFRSPPPPPPPSLRAFVIKAWHKCFKASTGGLPWLQSHPVGLAMCWAFPFSSGEMKIHVAKLSEPSFYDFKARQNPQERRDLCQMAVCRIPQTLLTFTICLSDLSNKDAAFWK